MREDVTLNPNRTIFNKKKDVINAKVICPKILEEDEEFMWDINFAERDEIVKLTGSIPTMLRNVKKFADDLKMTVELDKLNFFGNEIEIPLNGIKEIIPDHYYTIYVRLIKNFSQYKKKKYNEEGIIGSGEKTILIE